MTNRPGEPYWFDARPLTGASDRLRDHLKWLPSNRDQKVLTAFAAANKMCLSGCDCRGHEPVTFPSLVVPGTCVDAVRTDGPPYVEFGNHGSVLDGGASLKPIRRGYVAIKHDLDLPRVYVEARKFGSLTLGNLASAAWYLTPRYDEWGDSGACTYSGPGPTGVDNFQKSASRLDLDPALSDRCSAHAEVGREAEALAMLTGAAEPLIAELCESFDIEISGQWAFLYGYYGDAVTVDPEIWAWMFAAASRLVDLTRFWGGPGTLGGDLPFYTDRHVPRPAQTDGYLALLKNPLMSLKGQTR